MNAAGQLRIGACLSLSGRFAPFGRQAAHGLEVWATLDGGADVLIEDDASDVRQLQARLPGVAANSDLLLGPYSTVLMRVAGDMAAENRWLIWNHGGSGDDVEIAHPGHVVSVLTPASRYMEPFLDHLYAEADPIQELRIVRGRGRFGRQVADGAEDYARQLGFKRMIIGPPDLILADDLPEDWILISAGTFEDDTDTVIRAQRLATPPRVICAVAAGVREFKKPVQCRNGTFGVGQWFSGSDPAAVIGPGEREFLDAYHAVGETPDYPAIQTAAAASLAVHCARQTGSTERTRLWSAATALDTSTLYGSFKIDQVTGAQIGHRTVLTQWIDGKLVPSRPMLDFDELRPVVAAIVTSEHGVLVGRRNDGKPSWTFIAGQTEPGESPADAAAREVMEETGVLILAGQEIGRRVHPSTGRTMIYVAARPIDNSVASVVDHQELAEVRWASLAEAEDLMQQSGIFDPVRDYLKIVL